MKLRGHTPFIRVSELRKDQITGPATTVKWRMANGEVYATFKGYDDLEDSQA